ncbi:MAG: hypothetical protein KatS3mg102_0116 [Planctomycetota bacterium]|nr:MAG: hypothetical protein KatS3mg102_0116 [Planctomycetota bacterium]
MQAHDTRLEDAVAAARAEGLPIAFGSYRLVRLSANRRTGQRLFVYRSASGGTFCANARGVRTRMQTEQQRLQSTPAPQAEAAPAPAPPAAVNPAAAPAEPAPVFTERTANSPPRTLPHSPASAAAAAALRAPLPIADPIAVPRPAAAAPPAPPAAPRRAPEPPARARSVWGAVRRGWGFLTFGALLALTALALARS